MSVSNTQQIVPAASDYEAPELEVLGQLKDLATGQGEGGQLIVMQSVAIPG